GKARLLRAPCQPYQLFIRRTARRHVVAPTLGCVEGTRRPDEENERFAMKSLTSAAIVALTAGIIGVAGIVPAATAQQQPPGQPQQQVQPYGKGHFQMRPPMAFRHGLMGRNQDLRVARGGMRAGLVGLVCSDRGAERMEVAFVRLSYRLGLSA